MEFPFSLQPSISSLPPSLFPPLFSPCNASQAKVADFGLFKNLHDSGPGSGKAVSEPMSTRVLGTPGYVDPEYYYSSKVTTKCDVYR